MPKDGSITRNRILDAAEALILERGYAGMSVDRLIDATGITKGAFFYHFKSKRDLARGLLTRFAASDRATMHEFSERAARLARDPLQQFLVFVGLFEEMFQDMETLHPGCLYASYIYELQHFDEETREYIADGFVLWREHLKSWLERIAERYPPAISVDLESLADEFTVILEGAFVMAKATRDRQVIPDQLAHYRTYLELLFSNGRV